jgi:hypothetical protein
MNDPRFEMRIPAELLARVDEWRQRQTVPPTRAAAMRHLIECGLGRLGTWDGASTVYLPAEEWDQFMKAMDSRASPTEALRRGAALLRSSRA